MRAVAGSLVVLAAAVLVAAVLLASRLAPRSGPDDGPVNFVLIAGALALGLFGLVVLVGGLGDRPRPVDRAALRRLVRGHRPGAPPSAPPHPPPADGRRDA